MLSLCFLGPGLSKIIVFFCQDTFSGKKVLTSGSLELMKEQVRAALRSCHVVGVTQEDASRDPRFKGAPIRSGVSSELATELLPASPGRLNKLQNRCVEWSRMENAPRAGTTVPPLYLHEVQRYHPCTCTSYNGTTLVPARGTMVIYPGVISVLKKKFHKRTTSRYKGGTVVPLEGTGVVPSYLLRAPLGRETAPNCQNVKEVQPQS